MELYVGKSGCRQGLEGGRGSSGRICRLDSSGGRDISADKSEGE